MGNTTIAEITLHDGANAVIKDNDCSKTPNLAIMPLYLSDSDETDVFDFGGVVKTITLTGVYIGADVAALRTWIDSLEELAQGHQDEKAGYPLTFVDDLRGILKVKVLDFNSSYQEAVGTKINWTLKIVESSENA